MKSDPNHVEHPDDGVLLGIRRWGRPRRPRRARRRPREDIVVPHPISRLVLHPTVPRPPSRGRARSVRGCHGVRIPLHVGRPFVGRRCPLPPRSALAPWSPRSPRRLQGAILRGGEEAAQRRGPDLRGGARRRRHVWRRRLRMGRRLGGETGARFASPHPRRSSEGTVPVGRSVGPCRIGGVWGPSHCRGEGGRHSCRRWI